MVNLTDWMQGVRRRVGRGLNRVLSASRKPVDNAPELARRMYESASAGAEQSIEYVWETYEKQLGENDVEILDQCPVVHNLRARKQVLEIDPEIFAHLYG